MNDDARWKFVVTEVNHERGTITLESNEELAREREKLRCRSLYRRQTETLARLEVKP